MPAIEQITFEFCKQRFVKALADYVGPGKKYALAEVADMLDIEVRTMRAYCVGETLPPLPKLMRMMSLFGPGFANRILSLGGLEGCYRSDADTVSDLELNADVCNIVGDLGRALRDGRIDHRERPEIMQDARELMVVLQDWIAMHDTGLPAAPKNPPEIDTTPKPPKPATDKVRFH